MASSSALPKNRHHVRSISLPARSIVLKIKEELNRLRTWETSSSSSTITKAETIQHGLVVLVSLYDNVEHLMHSPVTQQALVLNQHEKLVEEVLDKSVQLLDVCSTARDFLLIMKEDVIDLQSALRRKGVIGDSSMETEFAAYITLRKKVKKNINKSLGELKKMNNKYVPYSPLLDPDQHLSVVVTVLREVFRITISVFRSLLMFMSVSSLSKLKKVFKLPLVSKLLHKSQVETEDSNEVMRVDVAISSLYEDIQHQNKDGSDQVVENYKVKLAQERLKALELRFQELENGLECMYKRLIQTRVSLLNIFTQYGECWKCSIFSMQSSNDPFLGSFVFCKLVVPN